MISEEEVMAASLEVVNIECFFGHIEIVPTQRWDAGSNRVVLGGYSITYDQFGQEVSRTEDAPNLYVSYGEPPCPIPWWRRIWVG